MNGNTDNRKRGAPPLIMILVLVLAVMTGFQVFSFILYSKRISELTYKMNVLLDLQADAQETSGEFQENGYRVEGEYEIKDTSAVSDAFISGDASALSPEDKETLDLASGVLSEIIKDDMTAFEKEKAVYDWMYENIAMDENGTRPVIGRNTGDQSTPRGVLKSKSAVCVGYATTFRLFVNMLGMECHIPHNEYHSWDLVQLDDGCWYHVDIYYDVTSDSRYGNFNMNDEICLESHEFPQGALPEAAGKLYTPQNQFKREIASIYKLPSAIKKDTEKGKTSLFYAFKEAPGENELGAVDYIMSPVEYALTNDERTASISYTWYQGEEENSYILGVFVNLFSEEYSYSGNADDESIQKMTEAYEKAFGVTMEEFETSYSESEGEETANGSDEVYED